MSLRDELIATPPKLTLSSFPTRKPLPPTPGALTPPLHPMVSIPFLWEEVPGRPRLNNTLLSPYKPKSFRCLELPPRLLMPSSPTTVLDGPKVGRTLSHKFLLEDISPKSLTGNCDNVGVVDGSGLENGPFRWASGDGTKWDQIVEKPNNVEFPNFGVKSRSIRSEVDIEGRMTRFKRKSKGSFYKLSHKSTRLLENMYQGLRQMLVRRCKEGDVGTKVSTLKITKT